MLSTANKLTISGTLVLLLALLFIADYIGLGILLGLVVALIGGAWAWNNPQRWFYILAFSIPFSIDVPIIGGVKFSVVGELLAIGLFVIGLFKWGLIPFKRVLGSSLTWLLVADLVLTGVSLINTELPMVVFKRLVLKAIYIYVFFGLASYWFTSTRQWNRVMVCYALGMIIPIVYSLVVHSVRGFSQPSSVYLGQPFFADHTIYAACMAFLVPFLALKVWSASNVLWRIAWLGLMGLFAVALLFSYSRAAWISVFAAAILGGLLFMRIKIWQFALIACLSFGFVVVKFDGWYSKMKIAHIKYNDNAQAHLESVVNLYSDASNLERINRWASAIRMGQAKPVTGFGVGTYQFVYDRYQLTQNLTRISTHHGDRGNAHSEYLGAFAEMGYLGLVVMVLTVLSMLVYLLKLARQQLSVENRLLLLGAGLGLVTFFVHGLFNSFLDTDKASFLVYFGLAVVVYLKQSNPEVENVDN